jgi:hypothetical protein
MEFWKLSTKYGPREGFVNTRERLSRRVRVAFLPHNNSFTPKPLRGSAYSNSGVIRLEVGHSRHRRMK